MATANQQLSSYDTEGLPSASDMKIAIVVSEWNDKITLNLLSGAKQALLDNGVFRIAVSQLGNGHFLFS